MSKFSLSSLRSRAIALVLLAIFPLLALTLYSYFDQRDRAIREVQRDELVAARNLATIQEAVIRDARHLLTALAQLPQVQRRDRDACNALFAALLKQSPHSAIIGATDSEGWLFASAPAAPGPVNYANRLWFQKVVQTRDLVIGEPVVGHISGRYGNNLAYPILDGEGRFQGALTTQLNLNWLGSLLAKSDFPPTTAMVLTDSSRKVLFRYPEPQNYIGKMLPDILVKAMAISDEGVAAGVGLPGDARLFAFTRLSPPWQEMWVFIGLPRDWAVGPVNRTLWRNLIWLGLVAIFSMAAAWFGGDLFILRPVKKLRAVTERLAAGDLRVRAGPDYPVGELGLLARSFDQMGDSLQEREAALRQSEEHYRSLFDNMLNGYAYCRMHFEDNRPVDFTYLSVNQAFEALTGLTDVEGKKVSEVIHGLRESDPQLFEIYGRVALTGVPERFETYVEALGMWFSISVYRPRKEHFVALFEVITERKRAEEALRESEERFRIMANAIPQLAWIAKSDGYIFWYNRRWYDYTGTTPQDMEGWGWQSVHDPKVLPQVLEQWRASIATGLPFDMVFPLRRADGQFRQFLTRVMPLKDSSGKVIQWFGTNTDVTERKRAEEALRQAKEELEQRVQERTAGLSAANEQLLREIEDRHQAEEQAESMGRLYRLLSKVNETIVRARDPEWLFQQACRIMMEEGDFLFCWIGRVDWEAGVVRAAAQYDLIDDYLQNITIFLQDVPEGRGPTGVAVREGRWDVCPNIASDPRMAPWRENAEDRGFKSSAAFPLFVGGKVEGVLTLYSGQIGFFNRQEVELLNALAEDLSFAMESMEREAGRWKAEEEIRRLNEELEQRIRERTTELEFANRELESFSYSVSHDLKAPIRAIQGFSRMLVGEHAAQLNTEGLRLLNVITSNTKFMAALIDDLLALSRLGRHEIRKGKINLTAMAGQVFEQLKSQEPERDLQFIIKDLPPAHGDPSLIKQVMVNLLTNAVKYTKPRKTAVIEVGGKDEGKETIYSVKDNGIGFDERYADKLFGVFQRLHSAEEYEGTGVGLAIVQRIIERHGGRVWAAGKVDEGATFYFALPKNGA